jgi:hypothetical protein
VYTRSAHDLFGPVLVHVSLRRFTGVVDGLLLVTVRGVRVVRGLFMITSVVMSRRFRMVVSRMFRML